MTAALGLADYEYDFDGLRFGVGTNIDVEQIRGLHDLVTRTGDRDFPFSDGEVPGQHYADGKEIWFDLEARGTPGSSTLQTLIEDILSAFTVSRDTQKEFHWKDPGGVEQFLYARAHRRTRVRRADTEFGIVPVSTAIKVNDPRWYNAAPKNPLTQSATFSVTNDGRAAAYPRLTFHRGTGETQVKLTNNTNGDVIDITGLPDDSTDVVADMDVLIRGVAGLIVFIGTTDHYGKWVAPRLPFKLDPGSNSLTLDFGTSVDLLFYDTFV